MSSDGPCIIRNTMTGQEVGYYDKVDEGMEALAVMVEADPLIARFLTLVIFNTKGEAVDSVLGEDVARR